MRDVTQEDVEHVAETFYEMVRWNQPELLPDPWKECQFRGVWRYTARLALGLVPELEPPPPPSTRGVGHA